MRARAFSYFAIGVAALTCAAPNVPPTAAPGPDPARSASVTLPVASEAPAPAASLRSPVTSGALPDRVDAAPAPSSAAPATSAHAALVPVASKPGVVACETVECDARSQVCCVDTQQHTGRCVAAPSSADTNPCQEDQSPWRCDENADCAAGSTCCESYACTGGCPLERVCEPGLCTATNTEICVPGAACRAGFSCTLDASGRSGACTLARPPLPCGKERCSGASACCWNRKSKQASCRQECDDVEDVVALRCVSPEQCGGYACGDFLMPGRPGGVSISCMAASMAGDRSSTILCRTRQDCPAHWGVPAAACKASYPDLPRGVKMCIYPT